MGDAPRIIGMRVTEDSIIADLADGRTISVPLAWSWRLSEATSEQRNNFEIIGSGLGVHWPDIDEDISAAGMLYGIPPGRTRPWSRPPDGEKPVSRATLPRKPAIAEAVAGGAISVGDEVAL